jgi:hypothetical protein
MKRFFENEKLLFAALSFNGALEGVRHFVIKYQPELTALLTILQIAIAALTLAHLGKKLITHKKK